jgi:hypothetical protein
MALSYRRGASGIHGALAASPVQASTRIERLWLPRSEEDAKVEAASAMRRK